MTPNSMSRRLAAAAALLSLFLSFAAPVPAAAQHYRRGDASAKKRYVLVFRPGMSAEEKKAACAEMGLKEVESFDLLDIVVAEQAAVQAPDSADPTVDDGKVEAMEEDFYLKSWIKNDEPSSLSDAFGAARDLTHSFHFQTAARAPRRQPAPDAGSQASVPWGIDRVGAPSVWKSGDPASMGAGVKVAVIDTGVDCSHPDLQCDLGAGYNALDESADPQDDNGHGTHVSGTIAGKGRVNPDTGDMVYGVAPMATIIPVKVLDKDGGGALSDVVRGINWAAENGVDVINMSLGSPKGSPTLQKAVEAAYARGVTIVAAAGNSGPKPDSVGYPGAYPQAIAVAASDRDNAIASFSSRGPQVAFTAPGVDIESTWLGGGYKTISGTSMATPHMAGLAALAIAAGARGPAGVRQAFASAAQRLCQADSCPAADLQGGGMVLAGNLSRGGGGGAVFASLDLSGPGGR